MSWAGLQSSFSEVSCFSLHSASAGLESLSIPTGQYVPKGCKKSLSVSDLLVLVNMTALGLLHYMTRAE